METVGLTSCSQDTVTDPYSEPDESTPHLPYVFLNTMNLHNRQIRSTETRTTSVWPKNSTLEVLCPKLVNIKKIKKKKTSQSKYISETSGPPFVFYK
jgi:hypothetical protein